MMNKTDVKFSVITVCYNSEKTIERAIKSIVNENNSSFEYIIIDGKSNDSTIDIINKYKDKYSNIVFVSEKDKGIYDAMNKGIKLAKGEWILFINSDDWLNSNILNILENLIKQDKDVSDAIYGNIYRVNSNEDIINEAIPKLDIGEFIRVGMPLFHQAVIIKRSAYINLGMFDISYKVAGDWDFISRMYRKKLKFKYVPITFSYFSVDGISSNTHIIERHKVRKKNKFYTFIDWIMMRELLVKIKRNLLIEEQKK